MKQSIIYAYIGVTELSAFLVQTPYSFLFSSTLPHSSACLILLALITRVFGDEYKLWSSLLRSFLQSPRTFLLRLS